ncbi:MAG: hypothetical protein JWP52_1740 [Rhizobacter sp.]|nr:hypothetical protein [Rhizobacter sp.]
MTPSVSAQRKSNSQQPYIAAANTPAQSFGHVPQAPAGNPTATFSASGTTATPTPKHRNSTQQTANRRVQLVHQPLLRHAPSSQDTASSSAAPVTAHPDHVAHVEKSARKYAASKRKMTERLASRPFDPGILECFRAWVTATDPRAVVDTGDNTQPFPQYVQNLRQLFLRNLRKEIASLDASLITPIGNSGGVRACTFTPSKTNQPLHVLFWDGRGIREFGGLREMPTNQEEIDALVKDMDKSYNTSVHMTKS